MNPDLAPSAIEYGDDLVIEELCQEPIDTMMPSTCICWIDTTTGR